MSVMDGLAAAREIRRMEAERNWPITPVIIVSANCMPEHVAVGAQASAQEHLAKPVNVHSLIAAISHVLEPDAGRWVRRVSGGRTRGGEGHEAADR